MGRREATREVRGLNVRRGECAVSVEGRVTRLSVVLENGCLKILASAVPHLACAMPDSVGEPSGTTDVNYTTAPSSAGVSYRSATSRKTDSSVGCVKAASSILSRGCAAAIASKTLPSAPARALGTL